MSNIIIKKVVNGGQGIASLTEGLTVMVKYALPGETINIKNISPKKGYATADIGTILSPHSNRIVPHCQKYGICGGCDLMHCSYQTQLEIKREIIKDLLSRQLPHQKNIEDLVRPPLASTEQFHYRQRIRLSVTNNGQFGFKKCQSHQIIPIKQCPIARPEINQALLFLDGAEQFKELLHNIAEFELQWNPDNNKISLILVLKKKPRPATFNTARQLLDTDANIDVIMFTGNGFATETVSGKGKHKKAYLGFTCSTQDDNLPPIHYSWETGSFCQVNLEQNQAMINTVLDLLQVTGTDTVLDLFCGMGNFSIPLAFKAKSVCGVEGQRSSIRSARSNAEKHGLSNTTFIQKDIASCCKEFEKDNNMFDYIILDPPRAGVPGLTTALSRLVKKRLLYISCDPATLCRDLSTLLQTNFTIRHIQPVDMFPQTHHIETMVLLEKN